MSTGLSSGGADAHPAAPRDTAHPSRTSLAIGLPPRHPGPSAAGRVCQPGEGRSSRAGRGFPRLPRSRKVTGTATPPRPRRPPMTRTRFPLAAAALLAGLVGLIAARQPDAEPPSDAEALKRAGLSPTDGPALVKYLKDRTLSDTD